MCSEQNQRRPYTVVVEGNIGSGKTTFLNYFKQSENNICILTEPVLSWRNCSGYNLLARLYDDPKRWSFSFQSYVQLTMLKNHTFGTDMQVKLMERSIYSARYCFVDNMTKDGVLPSASTAVLDEWFKWAIRHKNLHVDLIIYLRTTPEIVYERMLKRNRKEEQSVPFEYLCKLHDIHEDWLYKRTVHRCPAPVLTIDANLDETAIQTEYERCKPYIFHTINNESNYLFGE